VACAVAIGPCLVWPALFSPCTTDLGTGPGARQRKEGRETIAVASPSPPSLAAGASATHAGVLVGEEGTHNPC
jgi:hypothetical protein